MHMMGVMCICVRDWMCMVICANTHEIMHGIVAHIHNTHRWVSYVWLKKVKVSCKLDWHRQGQVVNRPCVSFFIVTRGNYDVCQWANCHSETWQELLQKITDIISRQGEWRRFFFSPTPDYLLSLNFIIRYQILEWGLNVPLILLAHMWLISGHDGLI